MFKTSNPALSTQLFRGLASGANAMTVKGTVNKTLILLGLVVAGASMTWSSALTGGLSQASGWMILGGIGSLILALITIFKKELSPYTAPAYAFFEGLLLGGISATFEYQYPGLVMQAVGLTFGTAFALLGAYQAGLISVTDKFRMGMFAAIGGIMIVYLVGFVLGLFGIVLPFFGNGVIGIGFSVVVCAIAALSLVLDFDFIEQGAKQGAPKYMEWYAAFGLMVTLIWLYLEILRLLAKLRSDD